MDTSGHSPSHSLIEVFLISESLLISNALVALLGRDARFTLIGVERQGKSAAMRLAETSADVIVLCHVQRVDDVPSVISPILTSRPDIRVLVLGPTQSEQDQVTCLEAGAVGYICCEETDADELARAITRVHAGEVLFGQSVIIRLMHRQQRNDRMAPRSNAELLLGPREIEVLQAFGLGLSTGEVANRLGITVSTVRTHLKKILEKLGAHSKLEAVLIAYRKGLIALSVEDGPPSAEDGSPRGA